jgi:hypothetical protein
MFKKIIAVYSEDNMKFTSVIYGQNSELMKVKAFGTHNFHSAWKNDLE